MKKQNSITIKRLVPPHDDSFDAYNYAFIGARGSNKSYSVINIIWEEAFLRKRRKCSRKHISRRK